MQAVNQDQNKWKVLLKLKRNKSHQIQTKTAVFPTTKQIKSITTFKI